MMFSVHFIKFQIQSAPLNTETDSYPRFITAR